MSKRQREAHADKQAKREKYYPLLEGIDLDGRMHVIRAALKFINEELVDLDNPHTRHPEDARGMRLAHLTITWYMLERMFMDYAHDLEIRNKESDLAVVTTRLVGADGRPLSLDSREA